MARSGEGRRSSGARGPRQGSRRVVPPQPSAAEPRRSRGGQAYCSKERLGQQTHEGLPRVAGNGEGQGGEVGGTPPSVPLELLESPRREEIESEDVAVFRVADRRHPARGGGDRSDRRRHLPRPWHL